MLLISGANDVFIQCTTAASQLAHHTFAYFPPSATGRSQAPGDTLLANTEGATPLNPVTAADAHT
jgi:hypothetical protein